MASATIWPISDAIVANRKELVRFLDALRTAVLAGGGGGGVPALPFNSIQFNNAGAFGGDANLLWDSGTQTVDLTGNLLFIGNARRMQAQTNAALQSNRWWFQASIVNSNTNLGVLPNGASTTALARFAGNSNPDAALQMLQVGQSGSISIIDYSVLNAGAQGTLELRFGGVLCVQWDELGNAKLAKGLQRPVVSKTANYTAVETDSIIFCDATAGSFTVTLPAANIAGAGFSMGLRVKRIDAVVANTVTIARAGADTIDGATTFVLGPLQACDLENDGVSKWGAV